MRAARVATCVLRPARRPALLVAVLLSGAAPGLERAAVQDAAPAVPAQQPAASLPKDAEALWAAGQRQAALALLEAQLAARPDDVALRLDLAARQSAVQRWQAALATLEPLGPEGDALRGTALYVLTRFDEALPLLSPADPTQCLMRVDALLALARSDEAEAELAAAERVRGPEDPALATLRGRCLAGRGRFAEAVPEFRAALARDPLDRAASFGLGQALVRTGAGEEGLAQLERHRALLPLLDRRDFALQSLDLDPVSAGNLARLGDVERELQLLDSAEARYRRAAELAAPADRAAIALRHARLLSEDRDAADAAVALLDAAAARTPDPRLTVRAGDILIAAGRSAAAVLRYEQALAERPGDAQIASRLQAARAAAAADGAAPPAGAPAEGEGKLGPHRGTDDSQ